MRQIFAHLESFCNGFNFQLHFKSVELGIGGGHEQQEWRKRTPRPGLPSEGACKAERQVGQRRDMKNSFWKDRLDPTWAQAVIKGVKPSDGDRPEAEGLAEAEEKQSRDDAFPRQALNRGCQGPKTQPTRT